MPGSSPSLEGRLFAGRPHPHERIEVSFHLRHRNPLPSLEDLCADPSPISRAEFVAQHGADPADVAAVEAFARQYGLDVVGHDLARRWVRLAGPAWRLSQALRVDLIHVDLIHTAVGGQGHRTYLGHVHLPADLAERVQGVFGLDNRSTARSHARLYNPQGPSGYWQGQWQKQWQGPDSTIRPQAFLPTSMAELYGFPDGDGSGQSIAIIELGGGYYRQDFESYFKELGVPMPKITNFSVNGAGNSPGAASDLEVALDVEIIGALVPGADIGIYFAPNDNLSFVQAIKEAIHDPVRETSVISISWAGPEFHWQEAEIYAMNEALHEAAVLGVTVCISSGDQGASSERQQVDGYAHVEFPASSPFALACGGTRLLLEGDVIASEVVWNDRSGATGGGVSAVFGVPEYQVRADVVQKSVNPGNQTGRGVPDVAGNADQETGYVIRYQGRNSVVGGTSAVAPLWAALVARMNQALDTRLGFLHPTLYSLGSRDAGFRDITEGNNANAPWVGGYTAADGWDACTGWGSPNASLFEELQSLVRKS